MISRQSSQRTCGRLEDVTARTVFDVREKVTMLKQMWTKDEVVEPHDDEEQRPELRGGRNQAGMELRA
jgi:hypothetical protein